jgi:peptidoglycan/xylan/chitin deacetylase (PgdA/CDA1 family)
MRRLAEIETPPAAAGRAMAARVGACLSGALLAGLLLPGLGLVGAPIHASVLVATLAVVLACLAALLTWRFGGQGRAALVIAAVAVAAGCFLIAFASYPGSGFVVAALLGLGLGVLLPRHLEEVRFWVPAAGVGAAAMALLRWEGVGLAALVLALLAVAGAGTLIAAGRAKTRASSIRASRWLSAAVVLYGGFAVFWVGSTAPTVTWFGSLHSHGPRNGNEVALTFDDGPNPPFSLEVADILQQYGAHGTFFEVGKAVVERPDISKELMARGEVLANHSYYHGAFSYLDPRYPELKQTQAAFRDHVGVCPALFRPPHGTHTPFMSHDVTSDGMTLVTWDVSAQDWIETDSQRLAENILKKVKPGSIILLHDGIDGNIGADRSVVLGALPLILQGLKERGLTPVTLDKLLNVPAYLPSCS